MMKIKPQELHQLEAIAQLMPADDLPMMYSDIGTAEFNGNKATFGIAINLQWLYVFTDSPHPNPTKKGMKAKFKIALIPILRDCVTKIFAEENKVNAASNKA